MIPSHDPMDGFVPADVIGWVKTVTDPATGKTIEGYAFTANDSLTRPDWVESHLRRFNRALEYYMRTGRIE
jgi:hypothetical protein